MRWPFGPPHLTLKQKNKEKQKPKKNKEKRSPKKKQQEYPKLAFQLSVKFFPFLGWLFKISLFWHLGPESAHPKNTIKIGVSGHFFSESSCASRNGHFWTKKPKFTNFSYHFFGPIFFSFNNKKTQISWNPYFYSVLANLKKRIFKKLS